MNEFEAIATPDIEEPLLALQDIPEIDPYIDSLDKHRWCVVRHTSGNGVEVSLNPFQILPLSVKLVTAKHDKCNQKRQFVVKDLLDPTEIPANSSDYAFLTGRGQAFSLEVVTKYAQKLKEGGKLIVHQEGEQGYKYDIFVVKDGTLVNWIHPPRPPKSAAIIRYGAIGDIMQASSVAAELKRQGYHVTWFCQKIGFELLKNDPNVDELICQDQDQVRNQWDALELTMYWDWLEPQFDKFINLSESIEHSLLAIPGKTNFNWNYQTRHKYMNHNYLEFQHSIAGIDYHNAVKFYSSPEEHQWAREERAKMKCKYLIVWCLAGSSPHKIFPYIDEYIARMKLMAPDTHIVTVGGEKDSALEDEHWKDKDFVHHRAGKWTIRQTLTFIQDHADVLVGPETGIMNAMCNEPMRKIIFLTHSSKENLTRDWKNTYNMICNPDKLDCKRCCMHRTHYDWTFIKQDPETGAAQCMAKMNRDELWNETSKALRGVNKIALV